jgi:hypothetical protein
MSSVIIVRCVHVRKSDCFKIESGFWNARVLARCVFPTSFFDNANADKFKIRRYVEMKYVADKMANSVKVRFKVSDVWLERFWERSDIVNRRKVYDMWLYVYRSFFIFIFCGQEVAVPWRVGVIISILYYLHISKHVALLFFCHLYFCQQASSFAGILCLFKCTFAHNDHSGLTGTPVPPTRS